MKDVNSEKQFEHFNDAEEWQNLPELELFDDDLSFVKKHDDIDLSDSAELDDLAFNAHEELDLSAPELANIKAVTLPDDIDSPTDYFSKPVSSQVQLKEPKLEQAETNINQQLLDCLNQLTNQVNNLAAQIELLKPAKPVLNPQKLFATGVYYAKHKDYIHAAKWFRRAALAGHAKAMFYLGTMFIKAEGLPQSVIHSYVWMSLANIYGATEAKAVQLDLQKHLTARELNLAQRLAADKYEEIEDNQLSIQATTTDTINE
ncbi:hypothetical protein N7931_04545 [Catenovulum sp. 2E275]|uniref:hypothetical protein n=1 Tax=Catenovulum sp. 2E275 TaxID=2980497 RepID=UPI0021CFAFE6|nr:hypothetical protein [Catenovulum sp. 2E275]MCU4674896.1 hypothetical protein [Catenovulum sp. 2E275]